MGKIKEILEKRSASYSRYSNHVIEAIEGNVIPAVLDMLDLTDNELDKLEWTNVHLAKDQLVLNGSIKYQEGDVITDGDMTVTIDASMALLLDKVIRVSVPIELAENGTKDEIYEHLLESQRQLRDEYESVYGHEPPTMEEAMEQALLGNLGQDMDFGPDFNYNELTDEQKEALFISMSGSGSGEKLN